MNPTEQQEFAAVERKWRKERDTVRRLRRKLEAMQAKYGEPGNQKEDRQ